MAEKTDLNVAPYFDDFDEDDNFKKILFRPGFSIQARELTQLQSNLQNQIERQGNHLFKEGDMVIPGQINLAPQPTLKLVTTFSGESIDPSQYFNATNPITITGETTGVTAKVTGFSAGTSTDQPLLHIAYTGTGTDSETFFFADGENISANAGITHTISYGSGVASATTFTSPLASTGTTAQEEAQPNGAAARTGVAAVIEEGVYYIRGYFVKCNAQTLILNPYTEGMSCLVGLFIEEEIITPELDTTLLDNSTGSSNFAAKGAHRLKIKVSLAFRKRDTPPNSERMKNFVQLMDVKKGQINAVVNKTQYAELEQTFARRTYDESGDYTVKPFEFKVHESVTINENEGLFVAGEITDDNFVAANDQLQLEISPHKAYVRGHEFETFASKFMTMIKARDFETVNAGVTVAELGNFANVTNIYGSPDISPISGETTAFKQVDLYDAETATRGSASGNHIGVARSRGLEYFSGTAGASSSNTEALYKLYLFDVRPFTKLTMSGTPSPTLTANHSNGGVQVKGSSSGATGFVFADGTSAATILLTNVVGLFTVGETITASDSAETDDIVETSGNVDLTISIVDTFQFSDTRQVFMDDDTSGEDFTADIVLDQASNVFLEILLEDDVNSSIELEAGTGSGNIIQQGRDTQSAILKTPEKNALLYKLPKKVVKTLLTTTNQGESDTQYTIRKQLIGTTTSSGVTFNAGSGETFGSHNEKDYTLSILTDGGGAAQGDIVSIASTLSGAGTSSITILDATNLPTGTKVKLTATLLKTSAAHKSKTVNLMKKLAVNPGDTDAFGTRPTDRTISLGRADAFKLVAVFDSENTSTEVTIPSLTLGTITGTFTRGELVTGSASGATARIIDISSPMEYVLATTTEFVVGETITGFSSSATSTVTALTAGSINVRNNYTLDTGMRDNFYDISRIVRRNNVSSPTGKVVVIYDYFEHGAGDVMTVDSYVDIADQMTYEDIPTYTASKIDPDTPTPTGAFPLYDTYDFRPRVENITGTSSEITTTDEITGNSFDFFHRQYDGTGASMSDVPKPDSFVQSDFEFFLPYIANIEVSEKGKISIFNGASAEVPKPPAVHPSMMKIAQVFVPAFTFAPQEVQIKRERHQRYTMKDIGEIEKRVQNVEYYTSLNLLERSAQDLEVTDANGLNRFKSGFVVDNFAGHRTGDIGNPDYKVSIDAENNELRPKHRMQHLSLIESVTTDSERTSAGYQKTGDLVTLPYTEQVLLKQDVATKIESIVPFSNSIWKGTIELSPFGDDWFETEVRPSITVSVAHDFDFAAATPDHVLGAMWNSWQSQWMGVVEQTDPGDEFENNRFVRSIESKTKKLEVATKAIANIERQGNGYRITTKGVRPFIRSQTVNFTGTGFKPRTRLYAYFNNRPVSQYISPNPLITDSAGRIEGVFNIPDPITPGNPKFPTGEVEFKLSSDSTRGDMLNIDNPIRKKYDANSNGRETETDGFTIYFATGMFDQYQNVSLALRPPPPPPAPVYTYNATPDTGGNNWDGDDSDGDADADADGGGDSDGDSDSDGDGGCWIAGTQVLMGDSTYRNIEDLKIGDMVMSYPETSKTRRWHTALEVKPIISLLVGTVKIWHLNDSMVSGTEWMIKGDGTAAIVQWLNVGDTVLGPDNNLVEITRVEPAQGELETQVIYNFETKDNYSYIADGMRTIRGRAVRAAEGGSWGEDYLSGKTNAYEGSMKDEFERKFNSKSEGIK